MAGYEKIIHSGQPINRSGASSMWSRRAKKKLVGAKNWFQDKVRVKENASSQPKIKYGRKKQQGEESRTDQKYESVWFVPQTPEGALKKKLQELEESLGFRGKVKYIELLGSKVSQLLCVKNPWKEHCGRTDCFPCMTKGGQ